MAARTQLNINVSPALLKQLKRTSIKSGKTLTQLVCETLENAISSNSFEDSSHPSLLELEQRLKAIEEVLALKESTHWKV